MAALATCKGVLNTLISNPDIRYKSKHPSYLLLGITIHLLMIAYKLSKVLITMRKDQHRHVNCNHVMFLQSFNKVVHVVHVGNFYAKVIYH